MKVVLWDFDGTLGYRDGMWGATLLEVIQATCPERRVSREAIRPYLKTGFPWHSPAVAHTDIRTSDEWWARLAPVFAQAFTGVGVDEVLARELAMQVRAWYCDRAAWHLYDDALPALARLAGRGWSLAVADLAERARTRRLRPEDVQNGTISITNPGIYGSLFGTPIINQPQEAILGVGGIEKRPVVVNDAIAIRPMVDLSLSFDHRVIDGAVADQFMAKLKTRLQSWTAWTD